ncbi:uncharacterized protein LOC111701622 [Eurytemora carolleeae]|uniref:uncharacterized protein LOC111701622 n=1 Tax=Eurytemora carolleeae TaxID=1294199 RepID=UPI000C77F9AA|nr:uncharacterized protein LOC111701622 [Eurytemora carolleeae]|eukprot:XP_023328763.1 uncharacterized protein LOC111701622 [Eurytemora affinis]
MLKLKNLFRILTIFSVWCLSKADEETNEELSWSNLSFLTSQQTEKKEDQTQDAFDTRPYMLESAEYSEDDLQTRRRRKTNLRRRRPEYSDYSSNLNTQIEDQTYYERVEDKEFAPSPSMEVSSSDLSASYQAPSSGYETPSTSYKAPLSDYEPLSSSYSSYSKPSYKGKGKDKFNNFLNALAAFLPIGLFLAAIPPNLIVINSARKKRETDLNEIEEEYSYPLMTKIGRIGYTGLKNTGCQKRFLCELANLGSTAEANSIQKFAAFAAASTPDVFADYLQAKEVFQAVRVQQCDRFECKGF